jgi:hypothetical protein
MDEIENRLLGFTNSVSLVLQELCQELAKTGAISKTEFPERLEAIANELEIEWREAPEHWNLNLLRHLADSLRPEYSRVIVEEFPSAIAAENDDTTDDKK